MKTTFFRIAGILLVVLISGGYGYFTMFMDGSGQDQVFEEPSYATAVARLGDLTIFASGTGQVTTSAETTLSFNEKGTLVELLVSIGDRVESGDLLARLQTDKTEEQLALELANAELALIKAEQTLNDIYKNAEIETAKAILAVENAQEELDSLFQLDLQQAQALQTIANSQKAIEKAEMNTYILNSSPSQDAMYSAYASMLFKEKKLEELQDQIETLDFKIRSAPNKDVRDRYKAQLLRLNIQLAEAQIKYDNAVYKVNTMDAPAQPLDVYVAETQLASAHAQLAEAERQLTKIQDGATPGDIVLAEANLTEAQAELEMIKDGPNKNDLAVAENKLETAQLELVLLQDQQAVIDLIAPTDGTILSILVSVGEVVHGQGIITLADLEQPLIEVFLDETDLDKIQIGYQVEVTFDALPESTFTGQVIQVDPSLVRDGGSQAIRAWARLDETSYAKPNTLPVGLNASADVFAGQTVGAVLVPIEALRQTNPDEYTVYVLANEELEPRQVTVGLMDFTSAEILNGVNAGDTIVIGDISTQGIEP